jgi:hypothetical protein
MLDFEPEADIAGSNDAKIWTGLCWFILKRIIAALYRYPDAQIHCERLQMPIWKRKCVVPVSNMAGSLDLLF